jgi:hypothetical protein
MTVLFSFIRICLDCLTWSACLHVFSLAGNSLIQYIVCYISRDLMWPTGLSRLLVAVNFFFLCLPLEYCVAFLPGGFWNIGLFVWPKQFMLHFLCSDKNKRNSSVVLYEDASKRLLQQFTAALRGCQQMFHACSSISTLICTEESQLNDLLSPGRIKAFFNTL